MKKSKSASNGSKSVISAKSDAPAMVRRSSAVLLCVVMLLAGVFMGWQGAVIVFNQDLGKGGGAGMHESAEQAQKGQNPMTQAQGGMNAMMGGGNPMMSGLMAQAKALEEKTAKNPGDKQAWVELGNLYFDADLPDRAVVAYKKALDLDPKQPDVWTDMGVMLREQKKPQEALDAFRKAIAVKNNHEIARLNVGIVLLNDLGDKQGAVAAWKELLAINPEAKSPDGRKVADAVKELSK